MICESIKAFAAVFAEDYTRTNAVDITATVVMEYLIRENAAKIANEFLKKIIKEGLDAANIETFLKIAMTDEAYIIEELFAEEDTEE